MMSAEPQLLLGKVAAITGGLTGLIRLSNRIFNYRLNISRYW